MFGLTTEDLGRRILGCGDGPASFNAEWSGAGGAVVSVDPVYGQGPQAVGIGFEGAAAEIAEHVRRTPERWCWRSHGSLEELLATRRAALGEFIADFPRGLAAGRYVTGGLPVLPFADDSFDLALCSHFLFLYSHLLDAEFHVAGLAELLRVAKEVRVFPLFGLDGAPSPHLEPVTDALLRRGASVEVVKVDYELQRGGDEMLRVRRRAA